MLAMTLYPDVMKRAQIEIDSIVGRDRMPNFSDIECLPYIRAMLKEVLRWRPITPIGMRSPTSIIPMGNISSLSRCAKEMHAR